MMFTISHMLTLLLLECIDIVLIIGLNKLLLYCDKSKYLCISNNGGFTKIFWTATMINIYLVFK